LELRTAAEPQGTDARMTPEEFRAKWGAAELKESAAYQQHFVDLCAMLGVDPPDLVRREPEVVPGFPDRLVPKSEKAAAKLKKRTLTNLHNARAQWLTDAHKALDAAVAAAYGWPADLTDDEILALLLALNLEHAAAQGGSAPAAEAHGEAEDDGATAAKPPRAPKKARARRKLRET